jgi:hypothetical protein
VKDAAKAIGIAEVQPVEIVLQQRADLHFLGHGGCLVVGKAAAYSAWRRT